MDKKYPKELIGKIAESIDSGMICFVNTETFEMEDVPALLIDDPEEFEALVGETPESMGLKYPNWQNCISFEPLTSGESFRIMEQFTSEMNDPEMKSQLTEALRHRKPFANFKQLVDDSTYRQSWFDYKKLYLEEHVEGLLDLEFDPDGEMDIEEVDGFYDDEGHKVDPYSVPIRSLCVGCKKHHAGDLEEDKLCLKIRFDQRDEEEFNCSSYEKI